MFLWWSRKLLQRCRTKGPRCLLHSKLLWDLLSLFPCWKCSCMSETKGFAFIAPYRQACRNRNLPEMRTAAVFAGVSGLISFASIQFFIWGQAKHSWCYMIPRSEISAFDTLVSAIWRAHVLPAKNSRPRRYSCALQRVATRNGLWQHWQRWRENPRHCTGLISGRDFNGIAVFYPEKSRLQGTNKDVCIYVIICIHA